jgi:hypothetical protein
MFVIFNTHQKLPPAQLAQSSARPFTDQLFIRVFSAFRGSIRIRIGPTFANANHATPELDMLNSF